MPKKTRMEKRSQLTLERALASLRQKRFTSTDTRMKQITKLRARVGERTVVAQRETLEKTQEHRQRQQEKTTLENINQRIYLHKKLTKKTASLRDSTNENTSSLKATHVTIKSTATTSRSPTLRCKMTKKNCFTQ
jgi:hypothetical protein